MLFEEIILVQWFSKPQQTVASRTKREPVEKRRLSVPSKESRMLESVMRPMAAQSLRDTASLKITRTTTVVATISKLPKREALE